MTPPIHLVQKRIANTSVGASTVRGKGRKGTKAVVTEYLGESLNLQDFSDVNSSTFQERLNRHTEELESRIRTHEWGIARKVLNIFLFEATHNTILSSKYNLANIIQFLEVPLDNKNAKNLKREAKEGKRLKWESIKALDAESNSQFQAYAKQYARELGYERCYLDLYWWGKP